VLGALGTLLAERWADWLSAAQHGDAVNYNFARSMPSDQSDMLKALMNRRHLAIAGDARKRWSHRLANTHAAQDGVVPPELPAPGPLVSVCHSEPGAWAVSAALPPLYRTQLCPLPGSVYRIGRTMFETDRLPEGWAARLNGMDEVWVPTQWSRRVFLDHGVEPARLHVVPEAVDTAFFRPLQALSAQEREAEAAASIDGLPARAPSCAPGSGAACPVRFLFVGKAERRKNVEGLLRAFFGAAMAYARAQGYQSSDAGGEAAAGAESGDSAARRAEWHAELVLLMSAYHSDSDFERDLHEKMMAFVVCPEGTVDAADGAEADADSAAGLECVPKAVYDTSRAWFKTETQPTSSLAARPFLLPRIRVLRSVPQGRMPALYRRVEALVQPSRGEGWGRPHAEAMASGVPVLATDWSGPTEFLTAANGYPIRVRSLAPIPDGAFEGHLQAEADLVHLRDVLLRVAAHPAAAAEKGAEARKIMVERYAPREVGAYLAYQFARVREAVFERQVQSWRTETEAQRQRHALTQGKSDDSILKEEL
jgi:glycosyltransferase involved in cell wall biosynthesis